ncbi:hypothetical protein B0H13DRAFT_2451727 [Mycena leptocephala]|nr:hypothetical protein B0H13DRAFT_2451727 [Mycena leptocephala]
MTVLINGRDEPRIVFDVGSLFEVLVSASSAEFTTDLVPVLSMTKLADDSTSSAGEGGGSCFGDVLVPGEFYYRNSWWAGKFEAPADWRGKANSGHIRGTNYRSFPRFRLMDLAAFPENRVKGLFDIFFWWNNLDLDLDVNADMFTNAPTRSRLTPTPSGTRTTSPGKVSRARRRISVPVPLERRWEYVLGESTAFAEFFTPWLVPYEHFIPVRPGLADLPAKIEWARANDGEAHCIQESGRAFAERILTDAHNNCYWFAVLLGFWGEG